MDQDQDQNQEQDLSVEPVESGVKPVQEKAGEAESTALVRISSAGAYAEYPLTEAVEGIGEFGVRGQSAMMLLIASVRRLERDLKEARKEIAELRTANAHLDQQKHTVELSIARLEERLRAARDQRWVRSILTTLGGVLAGIAVPGLDSPHPGYAVAATMLAVLLLATGWLLPFRVREVSK